jgi:hypothetical protein
MLDKCSNPGCLKTFHYFGEGRIYCKSCACLHGSGGGGHWSWPDCPTPREFFWLCGNCSQTLTLAFDGSGKAVVQSRYRLLHPGAPRALLREVA